MSVKNDKVKELQAQNGLPADILNRLVDDLGNVNGDALEIALQTRAFTKSGMDVANEGLIEALKEQYYACKEKKDASGMVRCKDRIFKLGGRLTAREKD